jgi:hypothetical protein
MASDAYAIEAMAYTTTALIDGPALDMSVEAAIVKVYGSECMFSAINECIQILGGVGFAAGGAYPFERLLRDAVRVCHSCGRSDARWAHWWRRHKLLIWVARVRCGQASASRVPLWLPTRTVLLARMLSSQTAAHPSHLRGHQR